ncbi:PREDICTED: coatomer subunit beta'-3-like isoform X1 [Lupinus angustifolius]|uniref:coatomer subunit beta'-3-like isoform X1 n=1 Tax=Lupinus angustifolius TaxID=3871 RepID=UPI00092F5B15|nr:PREDICTED: coatomer subunit beta'-3-like isoform X1 [Lupinus angustifolius]
MEQTLFFEIEHEFVQNSERVKSVDLHPTEPWILVGLYSGTISIWNYQTKTEEKSLKISELPVRSAKFITREKWVIAATDDKIIHVYNYEKMEKIIEFEGHKDYIRSLVVHPSLPYVLSASDDQVIKLWDWSNDWASHRTFEGHSHYVMQVAINPKDLDTFVSASLDGTLKIWSLDSSAPIFTLDGHSKGVNSVDYFITNDKTYILSGSDDYTTKVWDYDSRSSVQTLEGHGNNVTSVFAHPKLPIIITASEDSTVKIWDSVTFRLEKTLNYGLERVWSIGYKEGSSLLAFGCDKGFIILKLNIQANK